MGPTFSARFFQTTEGPTKTPGAGVRNMARNGTLGRGRMRRMGGGGDNVAPSTCLSVVSCCRQRIWPVGSLSKQLTPTRQKHKHSDPDHAHDAPTPEGACGTVGSCHANYGGKWRAAEWLVKSLLPLFAPWSESKSSIRLHFRFQEHKKIRLQMTRIFQNK